MDFGDRIISDEYTDSAANMTLRVASVASSPDAINSSVCIQPNIETGRGTASCFGLTAPEAWALQREILNR